ncbi:hypothetical protein [Chitinivorax sp. B]|uniref:hypothetical protein n=1 Tax=Chitinivorax sp. B TaxID=2502235 RepID=UPI0010F6F86B|nr:hypothetical protein [Chitinivorax sp. B]
MTEKHSKPTQTKLELTWPGKQNRPRLEPRILLEDKALSYHAAPPPATDLVEQAEAGQALCWAPQSVKCLLTSPN